MNVQARIADEKIDARWANYGDCTIEEAAKMHSRQYPFKHVLIEVRWQGHETIWQCEVERETNIRVRHLRGEEVDDE